MNKMPQVSANKLMRFLETLGFRESRVTGSHHIFLKEGHPYNISVPRHGNRPIKTGTLGKILRTAGTTKEALKEWLG